MRLYTKYLILHLHIFTPSVCNLIFLSSPSYFTVLDFKKFQITYTF